MTTDPQSARDNLVTYTATTRTVTADGLAPLLDAYRDAVLAAHQPTAAARAKILREGEARLRTKAQELSTLAEEELRRDLEDQAQTWHEAATELACMAALGLMPAEGQQVTP
jgi:acyl-CoA reductase-like NAD-dependent aldehyde dehydrogenase